MNDEQLINVSKIAIPEPARPFVNDDGIFIPSDVDFRYYKLLISKELFVEAYIKWILEERRYD